MPHQLRPLSKLRARARAGGYYKLLKLPAVGPVVGARADRGALPSGWSCRRPPGCRSIRASSSRRGTGFLEDHLGDRGRGARQITKFFRPREAALLDPEAAVRMHSPWMRCTPPVPEGRGGAADAGACAAADDVTPCLQRRGKHLQTPDYLERFPETKQYRLTLKPLELGFNAIARMDLRTIAQPELRALVGTVREAARGRCQSLAPT